MNSDDLANAHNGRVVEIPTTLAPAPGYGNDRPPSPDNEPRLEHARPFWYGRFTTSLRPRNNCDYQ